MGFRVVKDQIYYFTTWPPPPPPPLPTLRARPLFSRLFPPRPTTPSPPSPSSRALYIFTISFRCQTFQLTNMERGTMSRQIRIFARSRSCPPWNGAETDPKVVFSRPGSCSPDRSTQFFKLINRPRKIYTFMENLYVNKSTEYVNTSNYELRIMYCKKGEMNFYFNLVFVFVRLDRNLNWAWMSIGI